MKKTYTKKGFTLIELIVSIGVLAVLSTLVMTIINPLEQFQKANDAKRKSDLSEVQKALETYYQDTGEYPSNTANYTIYTNDAGNEEKSWGENWSPYMGKIPQDSGTRKYIYVSPDGQSYYLYASLERGVKDPNICHSDGSACDNAPNDSDCGGNICNFGVSSPNVSP